ncbi:hypothetical protein P879_10543 [Paragonimus westermani]|uniref:Uncharacterized protein n=1 Tax=Paragonimus westermani TaxID=34504 RepID=A0A8T0DAM9_9TREM|nr:hypothetical protein P879_10543 [Paragonimus westermani]
MQPPENGLHPNLTVEIMPILRVPTMQYNVIALHDSLSTHTDVAQCEMSNEQNPVNVHTTNGMDHFHSDICAKVVSHIDLCGRRVAAMSFILRNAGGATGRRMILHKISIRFPILPNTDLRKAITRTSQQMIISVHNFPFQITVFCNLSTRAMIICTFAYHCLKSF